MTEWLSYPAKIDGKNGVVDIDVDLEDAAFRKAHPVALEISVVDFAVDGDGMPTDGADETLYALEQNLETTLAAEEGGGSVTLTLVGDGMYKCLAYVKDGIVQKKLGEVAKATGLEWIVTITDDPAWRKYLQWLLKGEDLEAARDRAQLEELEYAGTDMTLPMEVTFEFSFADPQNAEKANKALASAGYEVHRDVEQMEALDQEGEHGDFVGAATTIATMPTADAIGEARRKIASIVAPFEAVYEGWGIDPDDE